MLLVNIRVFFSNSDIFTQRNSRYITMNLIMIPRPAMLVFFITNVEVLYEKVKNVFAFGSNCSVYGVNCDVIEF